MPLDQVITDDLIVQGSGCIGDDCVNGETFGSDTLRLDEPIQRVHFDDTSSGDFPANDWRILINDAEENGDDYFAIEDTTGGTVPFTIEAGVPDDSIHVGENGYVGILIDQPEKSLHIGRVGFPTIRLEEVNVVLRRTWDVVGGHAFFSIQDVTAGDTRPFKIGVDAPSDSLVISGTGYVGVGTDSPNQNLHVTGSAGDTQLLVEETSGVIDTRSLVMLANRGPARLTFNNRDSGVRWNFGMNPYDNFAISLNGSGVTELALDSSGNLSIAGTLSESSSREAKENFASVDSGEVLSAVAGLPITTWNFRSDSPRVRHMGPMAQDFYAVFGLGADDEHIAPLDTSGVALAAIQGLNELSEQQASRIVELEQLNREQAARIGALDGITQEQTARIEDLEARLAALEAAMAAK